MKTVNEKPDKTKKQANCLDENKVTNILQVGSQLK